MFNYKKTVLTVSLVVLLLFSLCLSSFCATPLLDSYNNHFYNIISSIDSGTYRSTASGNSTIISSDVSTPYVIIEILLKDIGFLSGESYKLGFSVINLGSSNVPFSLAVLDGTTPLDLNSNSFSYTDEFQPNVSKTCTPVISIPADFSSARLVFLFYGNNPVSLQLGSLTATYVNKVDTGEWSGDDVSLPNLDFENDYEVSFGDNADSIINFLGDGFVAVRHSVIAVSVFFTYIWNLLSQIAPAYVWLIIFSLVSGFVFFVLTKTVFPNTDVITDSKMTPSNDRKRWKH